MVPWSSYRTYGNSRKWERTTKTQPPEEMDLEPPYPTQGPTQGSQVEKSVPPDIKILIAQADSAAALAREAESRAFRGEVESKQRERKPFLLVHNVNANSFSQKLSMICTPLLRHTCPVRATTIFCSVACCWLETHGIHSSPAFSQISTCELIAHWMFCVVRKLLRTMNPSILLQRLCMGATRAFCW